MGNAIAGTQGEKVGATIYDAANFASTAYSIIGGGATGLSQTVKSIGKRNAITKQTFSMLPRNPFMDKYDVDIGMATTNYISLPKTWFRAVNGVGAIIDATTTGKNICEGLINIFGEEEE